MQRIKEEVFAQWVFMIGAPVCFGFATNSVLVGIGTYCALGYLGKVIREAK